jgi:hypothetical protein
MAEKIYRGTCFCGAVTVEATGAPAAMGYCHCSSCRWWSAGPVNAFTLWKPENVKISGSADDVGLFKKVDNSQRQFCRRCGGHLMTAHPQWDLVDVYAAILSDLPFEPTVHLNYQERVLPIKDGLPKLRDVPPEFGGSGIAVPE